jgi:ubiquinol-cytochrome c reductase cytochrome c subunit
MSRALLALPFAAALLAGVLASSAGGVEGDLVEEGERLYRIGCISCHGEAGRDPRPGVPSLEQSGAAAAHFYLSTGRMPAADLGQAMRKPSPYDEEQIAALVAYVASIGEGPDIPEVDLDASIQEGTSLYLRNCAACHQASGSGGALSYGRNAPTLAEATPVQVVEAMRVGPGQMPVFGEDAFSIEEASAIARYVQYLQDPDDRGGVSLGRIGPVPEGFVAIVLGTGLCLLAALWIGRRSGEEEHA